MSNNHPNRRKKPVISSRTADKVGVFRAKPRNHDHDYLTLLAGVRLSFNDAVSGQKCLFKTDAGGLYELYLDELPSHRQLHDCHACRRFIETYGALATVSEGGNLIPLMWNPERVPAFYKDAFLKLRNRVTHANVTSVFYADEPVWGTPQTGEWQHVSVAPSDNLVFRGRTLTPHQAMAASMENFETVTRALEEWSLIDIKMALKLLTDGHVARSEKFVGPVKWLHDLKDTQRQKGVSLRRRNLQWLAVASAPEGYCHPRASVVGSLLDDIRAGGSFEAIKRRFDEKLNPLKYQRPQAAPAAGNVRAAEALVEKLGIHLSLHRRFARLDEVQTEAIWSPNHGATPRERAAAASTGVGVFGHVRTSASAQEDGGYGLNIQRAPEAVMTWEKFARTVLPTARRVMLEVPQHGRFIALLTAVHPEAPPILKWDHDLERNPFSWYVYPTGSYATQWHLSPGWTAVDAVVPLPPLWGINPQPHLGRGVVLVLDGARDTRTNSGNGLFPECLKQELHGVRATIEAYSKTATIQGRESASACGYDVRSDAADCRLRAYFDGSWSAYKIDRWD